MAYRLMAADYDLTLTGSDRKVSAHTRETIRAVRNPVLVVIGARDPATPPATGYEIADAIPGAQRIELAAAHLSNLEQPEAFGRAVTDFLKG